jgi:hypothetical protein
MNRHARRSGPLVSGLAGGVACALVAHCGGSSPSSPDAGAVVHDAGDEPSADAGGDASDGEAGRDAADGAAGGEASDAEAGSAACVAGLLCNPNGNPCQIGVISCSTDASTCVAMELAANGTVCGTDRVCLNGACTACTAGAACQPNGNVCQAGAISCTTGQPTCVSIGDSPDGTTCNGGICCGGACAACPPSTNQVLSCLGATCTLGCTGGQTLCGMKCADTTSDSTACGQWCTPCPAGSLCQNSKCSLIEYGDYTPFQCAFGPAATLRSGFLLGESVAIAAPITVTSLGVVGNAHAGGFNGILALYTDFGGAPGGFVANTASTLVNPGSNVIPVVSPTQVPAGAYWIMAEYNGDPQICVDTATGNKIDYFAVGFGAVPAVFPTANSNAGPDLNYFVVGQP